MSWEQEYENYILAEGMKDTEALKAMFLYAWVMGKREGKRELEKI